MNALASVTLAISAFQSDSAVIALLERAFAPGADRFSRVIVVDSLGTGAIGHVIAERGWDVDYFNSPTNLGSAGNLDRRLSTAARGPSQWCLALNHDAELNLNKVAVLINCANRAGKNVGAIYPTMRLISAANRIDMPRRSLNPMARSVETLGGDDETVEVNWSSSNGAVYNLDAIRLGVNAWPHLWMGYEDLALGWEFTRRGYRQLLCKAVIVDDDYEFKPFRLPTRTVFMSNKPSWYSYYQLRNLMLIRAQSNGEAIGWATILRRAFLDYATLVFRPEPLRRARLLTLGLIDGWRGKTGHRPAP